MMDHPTTATTRVASDDSIPASEWDYRTIKELTRALQARKISASELLAHTIARIEALDRRLNAVVVRDFERAREAATAADVALARGERRALLGVPMTFKEAFNIAGLPTTWGFPQFKDYVPKEDALIVSRVKSAGAVSTRQDQCAAGPRRFPELQRHLRNDQQSVGHRPLPRWLLGRVRCGPRRRLWDAVVRIRHWRIDCACLHTSAASTRTSRRFGLVPIRGYSAAAIPAIARRWRPCAWSARWPEPPPISRWRLT